MQRTLLAFILLFAACAGEAATAQKGSERLQQLLRLPHLEASFGVNFSLDRGIVLQEFGRNLTVEIAELKTSLKGDASDAERLFQLGRLYMDAADEPSALTNFQQSVAAFRKQVELQPDKAPLLARFGTALNASGNEKEAESNLRRAVEIGPGEAGCWLALGNFLAERATSTLLEEKFAHKSVSFEMMLGQLMQKKPTSEQVDKALHLMDEAMTCFDKAVAAAPDEPAAYGQRAVGRNSREMLKALIEQLSHSAPDPRLLFKAMLSRQAAPDIWRMADLSKNDPEAIAKAVLFEAFSVVAEAQSEGHPSDQIDSMWEHLPDSTHQLIQSALNRLDDLGQNEKTKIAVKALELRGTLQDVVLKDTTGAESTLRRAIALDPAREQAWEVLTSLLAEARRYGDMVPVCEQHLKIRNTARNHIALAKAYEKLNQPEKVEEQVRLASELAPGDFTVLMSNCVLLLKKQTDDEAISRAQRLINRAATIKGKPLTRAQLFDLNYTTGILLALTGDNTRARQFLNQAQQLDPKDPDVKEALAALP